MINAAKNNNTLLLVVSSGMELSWLLAILILSINLVAMPLLIMPLAITLFLLSTLLTLLINSKSLRIVWRLAIHLVLYLFSAYYALSAVSGYYNNAYGLDAFNAVLTGPVTIREGLAWASAIGLILIFHLGGVSLARRELSYRNIAVRFDLGITAFILVFIVKGAVALSTPSIMALTYAFFIFGLPAIAMARNQQADTRGEYFHKYRKSAPILTFTAFTLMAGSAIALLFYPLLQQAATTGQGIIVYYGRPVADLLARIILFFYSLRSQLDTSSPNGNTDQHSNGIYSPGSEQTGIAEQLLFWALMLVVAAVTTAALYYLLRFLIKWLLSESKPGQDKYSISLQLKRLLILPFKAIRAIWLFIVGLVNLMQLRSSRVDESVPGQIFKNLSAWGAKSGRPRIETETPLEYTESLKKIFPTLDREITLIAETVNLELYGGAIYEGVEKTKLRQSWRRLHHPGFWPARLKSRLLNSDF